jgi:hypothetical protein
MSRNRTAPASTLALAAALLSMGACEPYRIERYERPEFYYEASEGELKDEWIAPDGTIVKFVPPSIVRDDALEAEAKGSRRQVDRDGDGKPDEVEPTPIWEEQPDGSVTMRAFLPQHVLSNMMQAMREERYGEFYDQLLAKAARDALDAEQRGQGRRAFERWCAKNRRKLMETLNRMNFGYLTSDVVLRKVGADGYRVGFTPRVASQFEFTTVDILYEQGQARLFRIR